MEHRSHRIKRLHFIAGAAASVAVPIRSSGSAETETPEVSESEISAPTFDAVERDTWWPTYLMWRPSMARYPASIVGTIMRHAENGNPKSLAYLEEHGFIHQIGHLVRMRANGETSFPISAAYREPPLTREQLASATQIPSSDSSEIYERVVAMRE